MAYQFPKSSTAFSKQPTGKISKRIEDTNYLDFIRSLPCIVTLKTPVEAAHISFPDPKYGKLGRGMGRKESDVWAIPLHADAHRKQHSMSEKGYWELVGIDPCIVALALQAAYPNEELALIIIREWNQIARRAN